MSRFKFFEDEDTKSSPNNASNPFVQKSENEEVANDILVEARYRCEQLNTTKVEDNISFHCTTKKQYHLKYEDSNKAKVSLEQFLYKINPEPLKDAIIATEPLEYSKENVTVGLSKENTINSILNFEKIKQKWKDFKPELMKTAFYKSLLQHDFNAAESFLAGGDTEFGSEENLIKTYEKSFFFHVLFNDYDPWIDRENKQKLKFSSQIFVNVPIELELTHGVIDENSEFVEIMTVGKLTREGLDDKKMEEQYNQFYKPMIEYNYTEYNYEYIIRRVVEKKTALLLSAKANLKEEVKYNYQCITQFDLKKID
ncbi:hypothetical protein ACTJKC_14610 [Pedobacter sp. 22226]|uniref:hypothetical protein n=1 Tax=Pedobacter sp. 22226 TaxID=3453894 RepID=UPI003F83A948